MDLQGTIRSRPDSFVTFSAFLRSALFMILGPAACRACLYLRSSQQQSHLVDSKHHISPAHPTHSLRATVVSVREVRECLCGTCATVKTLLPTSRTLRNAEANLYTTDMSPIPFLYKRLQDAPGDQSQKPSDPDGLVLEAWAEGFMIGSLIIMTCITIANMRRGVLLHKLILIEVGFALCRM